MGKDRESGTSRDEAVSRDRDDRLRELGRITGELLHDLGGTLTALAGRVALAREEAALGHLPSEELDRIHGDTRELRQMVLEMVDELRSAPRSPEVTFPLLSTVEDVVNRWLLGAPAISVSLRTGLDGPVEVQGPRSFFARALGNLLRNAARHAREEIRVTVAPDSGDRGVEVEVEDDGEGIPDELREHLFDAFVSGSGSAPGSGSGLGLSAARWAVERLGGALELREAPAGIGGARFRIRVPVARLGSQEPKARPGRSRTVRRWSASLRPSTGSCGPLAGILVAMVDDDDDVRWMYARLLRRLGARVIGFDPARWEGPGDGVEEIRQGEPDVVLLDVHLGRLSGVDLLRAMETEAPALLDRVLLLTGGLPPGETLGRPVVNKLVEWSELASRIVETAERAAD